MPHFATFGPAGFPTAFYIDEINGGAIPPDAVEITEAQWQDLIANAGLRRWDGSQVVPYEPPSPPVPRREVSKLLIVDRLENAGLGEVAEAALAADGATRRRWQACASVYADDPDVLAFLTAIGADPEEILAP